MKLAKRTLSILLAVLMLMGLLPLSAMAEEQILIHAVEATCDLVLPTYGQAFEKPRSFTMTVVGDLPITFSSSSSDWFLWDGTDWRTKQGGAFTDGTYCYDVHVSVTDDNYALAGDCTLTVNGVLWPNTLHLNYNKSAPFTIDYVAGLPLVFDSVSNYTIGANYVGEAIDSYSVASTVIGGTKPYTFAKTSGPDWITVSADGTVSGTPTALGDNENLVITATDAVGEQASITISVSDTYINPDDRQVISRVMANITYPVLKCGDNRICEISATVIEGAPARIGINDSDWYPVDGEGNVGGSYKEYTMVAGTYVMDINLKVDGDAGYTHMLDRENLEVIINGAPATLKNIVSVDQFKSQVWLYSAPIVIEHVYDNDTDSTCNACGVTARPGCDHQYAAVCDDVCTVCGATRVVADNLHTYDSAADATCNGCGDTREINYITLGESRPVAIAQSGEYVDFVFTPTVSGNYAFYSTSEGSLDTYGELRDVADNYITNDDQGGDNGNFKITFDAVAGTTYILRAKMYGSLKGNFVAHLGCAEHVYTYGCDPTCDICGETRTELTHTYDNALDTTCNECGLHRDLLYIAVGESKTVEIAEQLGYVEYVFIPAVSGEYVFYSTDPDDGQDTHGYLYNINGELITHDDDGGDDHQFKVQYTMEAGTAYILRAQFHNGSITGSFLVHMVCAEHVYTHGCDPTCDICGETRTELIHTYDNGLDTTCNECGATRAINYIAIGDTKIAEIAVAGQKAEFVFTPAVTAKYIFTSLATEGDPYGEIFLPDGTKIASDDDSAGNRNFKVQKELEAGTTYILCARYYSSTATGSYEVKLECGHVYDNDCDAICNACDATREVGDHEYSAACDVDCNECGAIREAGEHTYTDCTDTSCNACGATRTAPGHVYDGCEDTDCNVCGATRSAKYHWYYDCYDTTCEKCGYTRSDVPAHDYEYPCTPYCSGCGAPNPNDIAHTYDGDCDDECNVCDWGRIPPHTYGDDDTCDACGKGRLIVLDRIDLTIADDSWMPKIGDTLDSGTHLPTATVEGGIPFEALNGDDGWRVYDETTGHWKWMNKGDVFEDGKTYQYWWLFIGCTEDKATTLYRLPEDVKVYVNGVLWSIMRMDEDINCGTEESFAWCYVTAPAITLCNHTYSNACDKTCDKCGETREVAGHDYKKVITKATLTKDGKSENVCTICGYTASKVTTIYKASKISLSKTSYTYNGKVQKPSVIVKDSKGNTISSSNYTVTYASGLKNAGTYKVTVTMKGNYTGTKTLSYTIKGIDVSKCSITLSKTSYTYNGKVQKPSVTVKNASGTKLTTSSYTVTYASGLKNAGTYKVTVKMKGNYTGTKTLSYTIKGIDVSKCKITLSKTSYTYNGKVQKPSVTVKNASGTKLTTSSYTVTYASGLKNVGTYKVTIKMKGNYTGTKTLTYKINPVKTSISSLTAGTKKLTVKWAKKTTQVTGYQIQYSTSKSFGSYKTKTITSNKTVSAALSGLKATTTYYVRVRTYKTVNGTKYYSGWSAVKSKKTK